MASLSSKPAVAVAAAAAHPTYLADLFQARLGKIHERNNFDDPDKKLTFRAQLKANRVTRWEIVQFCGGMGHQFIRIFFILDDTPEGEFWHEVDRDDPPEVQWTDHAFTWSVDDMPLYEQLKTDFIITEADYMLTGSRRCNAVV